MTIIEIRQDKTFVQQEPSLPIKVFFLILMSTFNCLDAFLQITATWLYRSVVRRQVPLLTVTYVLSRFIQK